jgi:hypothetical protein
MKTTTTTRSPKQQLAAMLRRSEFRGCRGQVSYHGCNRVSVQIFNSTSGKLVLDRDL